MASEAPSPGRRRVVIVGGGAGGLEAMLALHALAGERVDVELIAPEADFAHRPLSVGEPFGFAEVRRVALGELAEAHGARQRRDAVEAVDAARRTVRTRGGEDVAYDWLILAPGARQREAVPGALTFRGPEDEDAFAALLARLEAGELARVAFAFAGGVGWPLPLYELAILTAWRLGLRGVAEASLSVVTAEEHPLAAFGPAAGRAVEEMLSSESVELLTSTHPAAFADGELRIVPGGSMPADAVVALPALEGPHLPGVPADASGFIPIDAHARVPGAEGVFAVGDATTFAPKQGGIATQHADAAAEVIAAEAGAEIEPAPVRPVLRGLLLVGAAPAYLRTDLSGTSGDRAVVDRRPLWWPPEKIAGRYLGPALGVSEGTDPARAVASAEQAGAVTVEVELEDRAP